MRGIDRSAIVMIVSLWVAGCAARSTRPEAMSSAHHEEAARIEAQKAEEHIQRARAACPGYDSEEACYRYWTSFRNPTKKQFDKARKHRELAEKHRAASAALRDAEARACAGVPDEERDVSPFFHREDIVAVETLPAERRGGDVVTGARVVFRQLPGMTADWLQRVVDCHLARNAAVGAEHEHLSCCPLGVPGVTALVRVVPTGLAVEIRPNNEAGSRAVRQRTEELMRGQSQSPISRL